MKDPLVQDEDSAGSITVGAADRNTPGTTTITAAYLTIPGGTTAPKAADAKDPLQSKSILQWLKI